MYYLEMIKSDTMNDQFYTDTQKNHKHSFIHSFDLNISYAIRLGCRPIMNCNVKISFRQ